VVPIARGFGRDALARVVEALEDAGIDYEVAEEPAGESPGAWHVRVPIGSAPRAVAALARIGSAETAAAPRAPETRAEPLFVGSSDLLVRALAMALCFGLALWLALR
jgi:hypothetical protein